MLKEIRACAKNAAHFHRNGKREYMLDAVWRASDRWHIICDGGGDAFREECAMLESSLIIADRDVDQAQATVLAIRNAGFDHPIFYFRSSAALIARLSAPSQKAPKPSTLLIDVHLLRECGPELLRHTGREAPLEIVALLSGERERALAEECGFGKIPCLLRPVKSMDVLRLLGVQATRPKPVAHPRLLWPGRPEHIGRPPGTPVSQFSQQTS